ncbi:peptidoglycan DD-metalloendopeptidase family protein [bacterium]|nr:peptidoglycan DD-metalloendopeptidase family protein [bacterium]
MALPVLGALLLSACANTSALDWDLRNNAGATSTAVERASAARPAADANGVISYPGYQVVVARRGDTVSSIASRLSISADQLASYNALHTGDTLRSGEVLALPVRVSADPAALPSATVTEAAPTGGLDVAAIATTALDRVGPSTGSGTASGTASGTGSGKAAASSTAGSGKLPFTTRTTGPVPLRYQVKRGETAFTIARQFNISAKALADWNGLGPDLSVREGQYLIIPTPADISSAPAAPVADATPPGKGSPTPLPPSAKLPLPTEKTVTAAEAAKMAPPAPDLSAGRTNASAAAMSMPVDGKIIRNYDGKTNLGIDISATAGSAVHAAQAGTVVYDSPAASTGELVLILRHPDGLLTVYTGLEAASVAMGATVKRGQTIGTVKAGNPPQIHFEVRQGRASLDPLTYLQ